MKAQTIRDFGRIGDAIAVPNLIEIQLKSYNRFLQEDMRPQKRKNIGLEALFREIFPIVSYDKTMQLEFVAYELEKPRYTVQQCRELRLTYGYPLKVRCVLKRKDADDIAEQAIYLGEMPVMIGGGEFIVNGAERVIVNQLHRSPGVDFVIDNQDGDRILHGSRIIPERGSWIEMSVTKKDVLVVRIDQSSKIPATVFLRAMGEEYARTEDILRLFYETKTVKAGRLDPLMWAVGPVVDTETGEVLVEAGAQLGDSVSLIQNTAIPSGGQRRRKKFKDKDNAEKWLKSEGGRSWIEENQDKLRRVYMVKGGQRTGGLSLKYVVTEKDGQPLPEEQLSTLEAKLTRAYKQDVSHKCPRFNKLEGLLKTKEVNRIWKENPNLKKLFQECKAAIDAPEDWIDIKNLDEHKKVTKEQGVYFFKSLKTGKVNDGYVGVAGKTKAENPKGQGLSGCLKMHFTAKFKDDADNLLKTWVLTELTERGIEGKSGGRSIDSVEVITKVEDQLILNTLAEDDCESHEDALLKIYLRLRPGNPAQPEKAKTLFAEKFYDTNRYRLGKVGRFRLNRKFKLDVGEDEMSLRGEDFLNTMRYIVGLRNNEGNIDDIDHLGNRRLRTIDELAAGEIRKGLLKLRRTVQERMSMKGPEDVARIADLVNSKSVSSSIDYFFGRGELSQVVDQTNALSQLTHERRLSALGPGGLNRKRAGFEVRDVHISHYGRVCPIETPEGTNIGLIVSLGIFSKIDEYGFLITPYRRVSKGKITDKVEYLRADQEMEAIFTPPSMIDPEKKRLRKGMVLARQEGDLTQIDSDEIDYVDISPKQTVGISASLIPFLEHDDANRALMGSNMQRQAVPLLNTEVPLVGTGIESSVAQNSSMVIRAKSGGVVTVVDGSRIVINNTDEYELAKFVGLNERTCLNQKPQVKLGEKVKKGQIISDGGGTDNGMLALGRNVLVAFVPFDGYNFEDAILISERLVKDDVFTSIHIDEFSVEVRETKLGREEFTRDIPNVSEKSLRNLDKGGVVREGSRVTTGDILVGKVSPKSKTELTPEEKLLHAIFGRAGEDVKNDSLEVMSGYEGVVIKTSRFTRRGAGTEEQRKALKAEISRYEAEMVGKECIVFRQMIDGIHDKLKIKVIDPSTRQKVGASSDNDVIYEQIENFDVAWVKPAKLRGDAQKIIDKYWPRLVQMNEQKKHQLERMKHGDELPSGVLELVKVYVATKRTLSIGDKMAGRHGNKGVIAKIMPEEDMPFLEDGTPVDICLNPLGVPSRMNVGQILETHLGWAAKVLGFNCITPVFDGATEKEIHQVTAEANEYVRSRKEKLERKKEIPGTQELFVQIPEDMKTRLYDGRTGEPFEQKATIGYIYMMKLHHLVDDKIHARATGPYSLITQQPLGGKARTGGQRFGEMEVWALEAYGAAYTLQELLTVKSDDIEGRTKIYESMVKGTNTLEAGTPISFDVLCNEIRGLGLNIQLEKKRIGPSPI
jgi:DNA-directed RNA polymerase subunit beta